MFQNKWGLCKPSDRLVSNRQPARCTTHSFTSFTHSQRTELHPCLAMQEYNFSKQQVFLPQQVSSN